MPRVFRLSLRGAQRRGNLVTMPEYVPTRPTEPTRPPRCARNDNGKTESSCRHAGLGQCPVKHPCWKPWLFLDFAHLKGRKRGDLQVGSTGLPGVAEHRGRQTVLQKSRRGIRAGQARPNHYRHFCGHRKPLHPSHRRQHGRRYYHCRRRVGRTRRRRRAWTAPTAVESALTPRFTSPISTTTGCA